MLSHQSAKKLANAHLHASGVPFVASHANYVSDYAVWTVSYVDPARPDEALTGGCLVVTDEGDVHNLGSVPEALTALMADLGRGPFGTALADPNADGGALPESWQKHLAAELDHAYWARLMAFVADERATHDVFPSAADTFAAFKLTSLEDVRVVILGQDPYHAPGQAHGLAFSVPPGVPVPSSLKNIHRQLTFDLGVPAPDHGCLEGWAAQGVLLLNTTLTVRSGSPNSHRRSDWKRFTDAVIGVVNAKPEPVVFMLWGNPARAKLELIDERRHKIIESSHPSGLSAYRGFNTSTPFSEANQFLADAGREIIDWSAFMQIDEG